MSGICWALKQGAPRPGPRGRREVGDGLETLQALGSDEVEAVEPVQKSARGGEVAELEQMDELLDRVRAAGAELAAAGQALTAALGELTGRVRIGAEDPVLAGLLGEQLAGLVRRSRWNSLVLNPGSTSTKVSVYTGLTLVAAGDVQQDGSAAAGPAAGSDLEGRVERVLAWMGEQGLDPQELTGIAARGGLMAPVAAGTYRISSRMIQDLAASSIFHASNLAAPMAERIAARVGPDVLLTTTDPVMIDEIEPAQRLTGSARIRNDGTAVHYLSHRAVAGLVADRLLRSVGELHLITCHMGGGMSAARHRGGRAVQVAQAFGSLPSANRCGRLPLHRVIEQLESRNYDIDDLRADVMRSGGLLALAGTDDFRSLFALEREGTPEQVEKVRLIKAFFANRVAGCILELSADAQPIDAVVLTGGLAHDDDFCHAVAERIQLPAPVARLPGAVEQSALAAGLLRANADSNSLLEYDAVREQALALRRETGSVMEVELFAREKASCSAIHPPRHVEEVIEAACTDAPPTIALLGADNAEALLAVRQAAEHGGPDTPPMARFLLLGRYGPVTQLAWELDLAVDDETVAVYDTDDPVAAAVELGQQGLVDTWMKGSISTAAVLKGYLRYLKSRGGLGRRLSHLALFDIPGRDKLVGLTDAAMNPYPDVPGRLGILENAIEAMHRLGFVKPKVAVLSATEKPSKSVDSSVEAQEIAEKLSGRDDLIVEGPLALDLAMSPDAARDKHYRGRIQGDADLLLVPDIDVGNAVYKAFTITSDADAAGVVLGGPAPLILVSRGDTARSKLAAIGLGVLLTLRMKAGGES